MREDMLMNAGQKKSRPDFSERDLSNLQAERSGMCGWVLGGYARCVCRDAKFCVATTPPYVPSQQPSQSKFHLRCLLSTFSSFEISFSFETGNARNNVA